MILANVLANNPQILAMPRSLQFDCKFNISAALATSILLLAIARMKNTHAMIDIDKKWSDIISLQFHVKATKYI